MTDPREDAAREWLRDHASPCCPHCAALWSEHPKLLLAAIDAVDPTRHLDPPRRPTSWKWGDLYGIDPDYPVDWTEGTDQ